MNTYYYTVHAYVDASCQPNPGPAGIGTIICSPESNMNPLFESSYFIGSRTVPEAEYVAVIKSMDVIRKEYTCRKLICFSDSQIVIKQAERIFKVRKDSLLPYFYKLRQLAENHFREGVEFFHINEAGDRGFHNKADLLAKQAVVSRVPFLDVKSLLSLQEVVVRR